MIVGSTCERILIPDDCCETKIRDSCVPPRVDQNIWLGLSQSVGACQGKRLDAPL